MTIEEIDAEIARLTALREETRFANLPTPPEGWSWEIAGETQSLTRDGYNTRFWVSGPHVRVIDEWGDAYGIALEPLRVVLNAHDGGLPSEDWIKVAARRLAPYMTPASNRFDLATEILRAESPR